MPRHTEIQHASVGGEASPSGGILDALHSHDQGNQSRAKSLPARVATITISSPQPINPSASQSG